MSSSPLHCGCLRQLLLRRLRRTEITAVNSLLADLCEIGDDDDDGDGEDDDDEYDDGDGGGDAYLGQRSLTSTLVHLFAFGDKDQSCETA